MAALPKKQSLDFFSLQESNRKKTGLLVFFFIVAVILIIAALDAAVTVVLIVNHAGEDPFRPGVLLGVAAATLAIVIGGSLFKTSQLKQGGAHVALMLGGRPVSADTKDPKEKQLSNVVEEMAIASGTPMPEVYVLDEEGINAFAAGWGFSDAVVCVTTGCLKYLSRDELQGVIAHEFSHVNNGDMRLNIKLMGLIFGILVIAQIGSFILRGSSRSTVRIGSGRDRDGKGAGVVYLIAFALFVIGYIGVFFGNLIMAAVSRTREFLADASAVQFTRNPAGISGALQKIGGLTAGSRIMNHNSAQASHLFFADGRTSLWSRLFATHPPLDKRISAIDPGFNGEFPLVAPLVATSGSVQSRREANASPEPFAGPGPMRFNATLLLASVGAVQPGHVAYAAGLLQAIPTPIKDSLQDLTGAQAVLLAILLNTEEDIRAKQMGEINKADPLLVPKVTALKDQTASIERNLFMPIASLSVNALKAMPKERYRVFIALLKEIIEADGRISLSEYMVHCMVNRTLAPRLSGNASPEKPVASFRPVASFCAVALSTIVWEGVRLPDEAPTVFAKASSFFPGIPLVLAQRESCTLLAFDEALKRLAPLIPPLKKQLLSACISIVSSDGLVTVNEAEYLRTVADALECPIPPLVAI
jgi:Zn-dependent protease with chaperone function